MGKVWNGRSFDEDWHEQFVDGTTNPNKDWQANAEYAAANNTQNPYTNEAGASQYDKSGLIPGNEPGSTLPRVSGPTRKSALPVGDVRIQPFPYPSEPFGTPYQLPGDINTAPGFPTETPPSPFPPTSGLNTSSATRRRSDEDAPRSIDDFLTPYDVNNPFAEEGDGSGLARLAQLLLGVTR